MHKKRIAIIIGGTSDIGYAIIERLIRKYEIIFSYNKNYKKARSMKNYFAHHISFFKLDINSKKEIISFVKKIEKCWYSFVELCKVLSSCVKLCKVIKQIVKLTRIL